MAIETSLLNNIAGGKGCKYIADTSAHTGNWASIMIQTADTTIATAVDITGRDLVAYWNVGSADLPVGLLLTVPINNPIKSITLTDGSLVAYNA